MKIKKKSKRVNGKVRNAIKAKAKDKRKKSKKEAKKLRMQGKRKKKEIGIPNLWPWKAEMLQQKLNRMKRKDAEDLRRKQTNRKLQVRKQREKMLIGALTRDPEAVAEKSPDKTTPVEGEKNKRYFRKELGKVVELADVVIEVLDARDPMSCRCSSIEQKIISLKSDSTNGNKRLILLLNKIDLVPSDVLSKWIRVLRREFPVIAFKCNTQKQKSNLSQSKMKFSHEDAATTSQSVGAEALLQLLKNYSRSLNLKKAITVGFIGYPNTGKSSVINSLKRTRAAGTSSLPGFTKAIQEIRLDANIKLIDSPGVLLNESDNPTSLVLKNAIRVDQVDGISAVNYVLSRCPREALMEAYMLPEFNNAQEFLFRVAENRGKLKKGGVPDMDQAARLVLQDWNSGRIPFFVSPPEDDNNDETAIVSKLGEAFDIDALLNENHTMAVESRKRTKGKKYISLSSSSIAEDVEMAE